MEKIGIRIWENVMDIVLLDAKRHIQMEVAIVLGIIIRFAGACWMKSCILALRDWGNLLITATRISVNLIVLLDTLMLQTVVIAINSRILLVISVCVTMNASDCHNWLVGTKE